MDQVVMLVATQDIKEGDEIVSDYGGARSAGS